MIRKKKKRKKRNKRKGNKQLNTNVMTNSIPANSMFIAKSDYKFMVIKWFGLIVASYGSMVGMIFARSSGTVSETARLLGSLFLALIPTTLLICLFMKKQLTITDDKIIY